ncbi:putative reverse transcriptase domain-containing protein [Tanacetum coccineum]
MGLTALSEAQHGNTLDTQHFRYNPDLEGVTDVSLEPRSHVFCIILLRYTTLPLDNSDQGEQPLPPVDSPTVESPRYVAELNPEEDPEEYEDDESNPKDGPVDYPMDGGEDGDDDDGDSSRDDADNKDEDEEEEHLAPADSTVVVPTVELVSPPEGTEPGSALLGATTPIYTFITTTLCPHHYYITGCPYPNPDIQDKPPRRPFVVRLPAAYHHPSTTTTYHQHLNIPPPIDRRDDIPKFEWPPCKRLCLFALGSSEHGVRKVGYGIRDTWVDPAEAVPEIAPMTVGGGNTRVTERMEGVVGLTRWIEKMESVFNISGCAIENQTDNKRKADDSSRNNHGHQQQPFKRQNVSEVYNMGLDEKKPYDGSLPKSPGNTNVTNAQRDNKAIPKGNGCFECGAPGHFKRDCPKLKNKDWEMGMHKAGSLIDIALTPLENSYDVELADGKIVGIDIIIRGCTLNFLNHPFNIDLMPVELGGFDVIIGMDRLRRCHVMIVCDEKLVRIPYGNETLIFCSNKSNNGRESRLTIISCSKAQEYIAKGSQIFLAQISAKKEEDKSEGKQLKDVPIV